MSEPRRQSYHHGDLRAALLGRAMAMLERAGPEELSLRKLAAAAGVSRTAPYAHFQDKRALFAAVAEVGFERLAEEMSSGTTDHGAARERFLATGGGYVRFALANPNLFKLMFSAELGSLESPPGLRLKSERSFEIFRCSLEGFLRERAPDRAGTAAIRTMAWSCVHGLSMLLIEGRLPAARDGAGSVADEVTRLVTDLLDR